MTKGYKKIVERIEKYKGNFPPGTIENRLKYLGLQDLFSKPKKIINDKGFPFKYNQALDEAILILHYFIIQKHIYKDGKLKLYCIHEPLQEEELTLSFWRSAKAGLFLDCHALIKNFYNSSAELKRIFVFRDKAHLTQIEQAAISVLYEQMALGIDIGLLFKDKIAENIRPFLKNNILIDFSYKEDSIEKRKIVLLSDNTTKDSFPYQGNDIQCRWMDNIGKSQDIKKIIKLFENVQDTEHFSWIHINEFENFENNGNVIFKLPKDPLSIRSTLEQIYGKLHERNQIFEKYDERLDKIFDIKGIDIIQCLLKINSVNGEQFHAVDSTSYKSSLERHDTDPMYRNWLRSILKGVLTNGGNLERIYILDTQESNKALIEYNLFVNEIAQYSDYINNYFTELLSLWEINGFILKHNKNKNIKLFVTTTKQLDKLFASSGVANGSGIFRYPLLAIKHEITADLNYDSERANLSSLDFLICSSFTFNFLDKASNATSPEKKSRFLLSNLKEYSKEYLELETNFVKLKDISYQIKYEDGRFTLPSELSILESEIERTISENENKLKLEEQKEAEEEIEKQKKAAAKEEEERKKQEKNKKEEEERARRIDEGLNS